MVALKVAMTVDIMVAWSVVSKDVLLVAKTVVLLSVVLMVEMMAASTVV